MPSTMIAAGLFQLVSGAAHSCELLFSVAESLHVELACVILAFFLASYAGTNNAVCWTSKTGDKRGPKHLRQKQIVVPLVVPNQKQAPDQRGNANRDVKADPNAKTEGEHTSKFMRELEMADVSRLRDGDWVVQRILQLCQSKVQLAIEAYRRALSAGLDLKQLRAVDCKELFTSLVTSSVRAGETREALELLHDLRIHGPGVDNGIFASVMKICTSKHLFADSIMIYDGLAACDGFSINDRSVWSCLLACAVESRSFQHCGLFFERLRAIDTPTQKEYWNMIRAGSLQGDWQLLVSLLKEMKECNVHIDNVIYNTVLDCCVSSGQADCARMLIEEMDSAQVADVITYNTLIKGHAKNRDLDNYSSSRVSEWMRKRGIAPKVFEQLTAEQSCSPDLASLSISIKANCDAGCVEAARELLNNALQSGVTPNELIYNVIFSGCAKEGNAQLAKRVYQDMVACGLPPSNQTFSILIRLYKQCNLLDEAVQMLRTEPAKHSVEVNPRLYSQLLQWCIRDRKGASAVEAYVSLAECCSPSAATHSWILGMCVKLKMFETAVEILGIAANGDKRVGAADAMAVLQGAARKGKTQCAEQCALTMRKLGLPVDPALVL